MGIWQHFKTITRHKLLVMKYCFRIGLYKQGYLRIPGLNFLWDANITRETEALIMQSGKPQDFPLPGFIIMEETSIISNTGWIMASTVIPLSMEYPCPENILQRWW